MTGIFSLTLCLEQERGRAVRTTPGSFPSEPSGGKIHQPESQINCMDAAAGVLFAFCWCSHSERLMEMLQSVCVVFHVNVCYFVFGFVRH